MFSNYLKIAFRNLWKHKTFAGINIAGLAVGLAACFLIMSYVRFELSYDRFHTKAERICRLTDDVKTPTETIHGGLSVYPAAPALQEAFPEIEAAVRVTMSEVVLSSGDRKFREKSVLFCDSLFFHVFDFPLLAGNPATALAAPGQVVLTKDVAEKYFGNTDPIGKSIKGSAGPLAADLTVTGIVERFPANSQLQGDVLISMATLAEKENMTNWTNHAPFTYLLLRPGADYKALQAKLPDFVDKHVGELSEKLQMYYTYELTPLPDVYLGFADRAYAGITGKRSNVRVFSLVAVMILLIACFNFINLATARATDRAREVGIRKVAGAYRQQLVLQYIGESVLLCFVAFLFSIVLCAALLPLFNQLSGKTVFSGALPDPEALAWLLGGALLTGMAAGIYPAWILSGFMPVKVLKGRVVRTGSGVSMRKGLVVTQFAISLSLIIATMIVYKQVNFMRQRDLGFHREQTLVLDTDDTPAAEPLRHALAGLPGVTSVCRSSAVPGTEHTGAYSELENVQGDLQKSNVDLYFVDFKFIPQYQLKMVAGRAFSPDFRTDSTQAMVLNEAAVKMLGYAHPAAAVGRRFKQWGHEGKIIGVVKDFHYHSLQQQIQPLSMRIDPGGWELMSVRLNTGDLQATLAAIERLWNTGMPDKPFNYRFLDQQFNAQYQADERFGRLFFYFSVLAVFISCLGLLGLVAYSTVQRAKEIGIRKVLGASVTGVLLLLSREFIVLIAIAAAIAMPLVWYGMQHWLNGYAYRTYVAWWVFAAAWGVTLIVALLTVSVHALKAATANPVKALRAE